MLSSKNNVLDQHVKKLDSLIKKIRFFFPRKSIFNILGQSHYKKLLRNKLLLACFGLCLKIVMRRLMDGVVLRNAL